MKLTLTSSPHLHADQDLKSVMYDVVLALLPACAVSIYLFGFRSLAVIMVATLAAMAFEAGVLYLRGRTDIKETVLDGSAIITGILLALNVPPTLPLWMTAVGSFVAIVIAKHLFGGLGFNVFNPALIARVFLLISYPVHMTAWIAPRMADTVTSATPLGMLKTEGLVKMQATWSNMDFFLGNTGGSLGEMSALALLLGGAFLLYRKVISWEIPLSMLASLALFTGIFWAVNPGKYADPLFHVLTGGAILGAFFMATDMVTSPVTPKGMLIFGAGIGLLTGLIRLFGGFPEGVSFAILIMNALVPTIDKYTKTRKFGLQGVVA